MNQSHQYVVEAQQITCPRSHNWNAVEPEVRPTYFAINQDLFSFQHSGEGLVGKR